MQLANYHAHSHFSDGREGPEDYLKNAIRQGLKAYGFADHAPVPIENFGIMSMQQLEGYGKEIERLKTAYGDQIQVYKSLEVDYIPNVISVDSPHIKAADLDYTVGAVHFVDTLENGRPWGFEGSLKGFEKGLKEAFGGDIKYCLSRYYALIRDMVQNHCPDVVAHLDRIKKQNKDNRFFSEKESWYQKEVLDTLEVIASSGAIMEINTKGYYNQETEDTYPGRWVLEAAKDMKIPLHLSSDAHHPDNITKGFDYGAGMLRSIGITSTRIFLDGEWVDEKLEHNFDSVERAS